MANIKDALDMSKFGRRDSLVHQASVDRLQNAAIKQQNVEKHRREIAESLEYARILKLLNDEGIELIWSSGANVSMRIAVILAAEEDSTQFLSTILMEYKINGVRLKHLEIRPEQKQNESFVVCDMKKNLKVKFEIFTDCECTKDAFLNVTKCLADRYHILRLNIYGSTDGSFEKVPWFPKHISDLDKCYHCVIKYEPTSDPRHPGHGDNAYIQRREQLNVIAKAYKYGDKLPDIEYSPEEHKTWEVVFNKLKSLHSSHTCMEYQQNFKQMELEGLLEPTRIPKLSLVNKYLQRKTGFTVCHLLHISIYRVAFTDMYLICFALLFIIQLNIQMTRSQTEQTRPLDLSMSEVREGQMERHNVTHINQKPLRCPICGRDFSRSFNLRNHMLIHSDKNPFKCSKCKKSYAGFSNMKRHEATIYIDEKPLKCSTCKKSFSRRDHLKSHQLVHTNERPYNCSVYRKSYRWLCNFKSHMETHGSNRLSASNQNPSSN